LPDNSDGTPEWFWLAFLKDDREEVYEVLSDNNPDVKKAVVRLKELSADEKARLVFEARQKAEWDQLARDKFVRQEGRREGLLAVARKALTENVPIETIQTLTGLSVEEIRALLH
jgi:predicted transposase YdaD